MREVAFVTIVATTLAGCASLHLAGNPGGSSALETRRLPSGVQQKNVDSSVRPQDDLFTYANGRWLQTTAIPADRSRYGVDSIMRERSLMQQRELLEGAGRAAMPDVRKAGAFYASFMDEARIEAAGLAPLGSELGRIDAAASRADLSALMGHLDSLGVPVPISSFIDPDARRSDRYAFWIYGSGLGLPERDYYTNPDPKFVQIRQAYLSYLTDLLASFRRVDPAGAAERVIALETRIAATHWSRVDARDPDKTYNPVTIDRLRELSPDVDWDRFTNAERLGPKLPVIIVRQPSTVKGVGELLRSMPLPVWKDYFRARLLSAYAPYLPKRLAERQFDFEQRTLQGTQAPPERWKRGVALVDGLMGDATGRLYVERHFSPQAKREVDTMVHNLLAAYERAIDRAHWMAPATKAEAVRKLRAMSVKVGHPDSWRSYDGLEIGAGDLLGNILRAQRFEADRKRRQMLGPVDRAEWRMTAATVDAYYSPTTNEIAFPAGILQPPLFDPTVDAAYNYGSTGATIGHEIGHGFDSRGSRYDADGNLRDWWSAEDRRRFDEKAALLVAQFSSFEPLPGQRVDGKLTLAENMADLAGLEIAYDAYLASLDGKEPPVIDGLTGQQRFLIGYAQSYMGKRRDELLTAQLKNNPHAPEKYRVNGAASNLGVFYEAFAVRPGDLLYIDPTRRVSLWAR